MKIKIGWGTSIVIAFAMFMTFILYFVIKVQSDSKYDNDLVVEYGINPEIPFVLFVGRITRQKGISQLSAAAQYFNKNCQDFLKNI